MKKKMKVKVWASRENPPESKLYPPSDVRIWIKRPVSGSYDRPGKRTWIGRFENLQNSFQLPTKSGFLGLEPGECKQITMTLEYDV